MRFRHLDYPDDTPVTELGPAAVHALLERGDLADWGPLARAVRADPQRALADVILRIGAADPMYGTSALWGVWIQRLRGADRSPRSLRELRHHRELTQQDVAARMRISQSDVSKLERRRDIRLSTLRSYVAATGGRLELRVRHDDSGEETALDLA